MHADSTNYGDFDTRVHKKCAAPFRRDCTCVRIFLTSDPD